MYRLVFAWVGSQSLKNERKIKIKINFNNREFFLLLIDVGNHSGEDRLVLHFVDAVVERKMEFFLVLREKAEKNRFEVRLELHCGEIGVVT